MRSYLSMGLAIIASFMVGVQGEVTYVGNPGSPWLTDALYLGAGLVVTDPSTDVTVQLERATRGQYRGRLFFVQPGRGGSLVPLFDNTAADRVRGEAGIDLGRFPAGTPLVFQYIIDDNAAVGGGVRGKRLYSGENRPGTDDQTSDVMASRWAAAGTVDSRTVEVGFTDRINYDFASIVFLVKGARLVK